MSNEKLAISAKWAYNHYQDTLKRMKKWNPEGLDIVQGQTTIYGITDEGKYIEQHLLTYEYWKDHHEKKKEKDEKNYDERNAFKDHTHEKYAPKELYTIFHNYIQPQNFRLSLVIYEKELLTKIRVI